LIVGRSRTLLEASAFREHRIRYWGEIDGRPLLASLPASRLGGIHYHVTATTISVTPVKPETSNFSPDQQRYFKIVSLKNWIANGNRFASDIHRDTFYVRQIAPQVTQGDVARSKFYGGD
jgi:hypothetical protein